MVNSFSDEEKKKEATYINQTKVVFIYGELFWSNLLLQSWGIGALKNTATGVILSGSHSPAHVRYHLTRMSSKEEQTSVWGKARHLHETHWETH